MAILFIGPHRNPDFASDYHLSPVLAPGHILAQFPPHISPKSSVLASSIALPEYPLIVYAVFSGDPSTKADNLNCIEHARRKVLLQSAGRHVLNSLLPAVHISRDASALYVFAFGSSDRTSEAQNALATLQLDDLVRECRIFCLFKILCLQRKMRPTAAFWEHPTLRLSGFRAVLLVNRRMDHE